jgi:hypothetical protein
MSLLDATNAQVTFFNHGPSASTPVLRFRLLYDAPAIPSAASAWAPLTLIPPWTNYGGGWGPAMIRQVGDEVQLRGLVNGGSASSNIAVVPAPSSSLIFVGADANTATPSSAAGRIDVGTSGYLTYSAPGGYSNYLSLANVRYSVTA